MERETARPADLASGQNQPLTRAAIVTALACCMLWGANSVALKIAGRELPPLLMAGLRFALGFIGTFAWARWAGLSLRLSRGQGLLVAINGALLFAQIGLFHVGTARSSSIHSVILINVFPFFTALAARFLLPSFPLSRRKAAGLAVAFTGVVAMFGDQLLLPDRAQLIGDGMLIVSSMLLGFKLAYVKTLLARITTLKIVFWEAFLSVPMFLAASLLLEGPFPRALAWSTIWALLYQGWAVSCVAFVWWMLLLHRHSPNDLAVFSFATPIFGMLFGWLMLGERLTPFLLVGGLLVAAGIHLVNSR